MQKPLFLRAFVLATALVSALPVSLSSIQFADAQTLQPLPALPTEAPTPVSVGPIKPGTPVRLIIPSLGIDSPIQAVGTNAKGEMAVPSGKSNAVGWYKNGTVPGKVGSAVIDAHVFAAFAKLKNAKAGTDVYVVDKNGNKIHFVVNNSKTYALKKLSSNMLFRPTSNADLNLITCAGSLTADHSTYSHRLIVYATLMKS